MLSFRPEAWKIYIHSIFQKARAKPSTISPAYCSFALLSALQSDVMSLDMQYFVFREQEKIAFRNRSVKANCISALPLKSPTDAIVLSKSDAFTL